MNVLSHGQLLPLYCSYIGGRGKDERFEACADSLVGVIAHCSFAHLFPT